MTALLSADEAENQGLVSSDGGITLSLYSVFCYRLPLYPPSEDARAVLKSEIELCNHESDQNQAIYDLGDMYFKHFIQVFFRTGTRETSTPESEGLEDSPKPPSCYALLMVRIPDCSHTTPTARDHSHAKAAVCHPCIPTSALITGTVSNAERALARDNFSCLMSGKPDMQSYWKRFITEVPPDKQFAVAECCYIFRRDSLGDPGTTRNGITTMTVRVANYHHTSA
ncbi:hypothetical protein LXA43DRAFT_90474 [Ganoderma leucocontextum]|nr:hypothetical protein LXA43DRAFT_90474 [Ganoderma leucocontextum]